MQLPVVVSAGTRTWEAVAEDISPGGALLRLALDESTERLLARFALPDGKQLRVVASVRWRRAGPPAVGVEFERFLPADPE